MPAPKLLKRILGRREKWAHQALCAAAGTLGLRVFSKLKITDVIHLERCQLSGTDFVFASHATLDFVITDSNYKPQLAIDWMEPLYLSRPDIIAEQRKAELCQSLRLPLFQMRVDSVDLDRCKQTFSRFFKTVFSSDPTSGCSLHSPDLWQELKDGLRPFTQSSFSLKEGLERYILEATDNPQTTAIHEFDLQLIEDQDYDGLLRCTLMIDTVEGPIVLGTACSAVPTGSSVCPRWLAQELCLADSINTVRAYLWQKNQQIQPQMALYQPGLTFMPKGLS